MPGAADNLSALLNFLLQSATGKDLNQYYNTPNPLWQALGQGSQHHAAAAEGISKAGIGGLAPLLGLGVEGVEAMMTGRGTDFLKEPDTIKDIFANFIGAVSGSPMPEMLKAKIMNEYVPYTMALPSGPNFPRQNQNIYLPSTGEK